MKRIITVTILVAASTGLARAACDLNGNCYSVQGDDVSGYRVQGYNLHSGKMWNKQIDQQGERGFDADNNYYTYDRNTGTYFNHGTGKMCFGEGAARICQ